MTTLLSTISSWFSSSQTQGLQTTPPTETQESGGAHEAVALREVESNNILLPPQESSSGSQEIILPQPITVAPKSGGQTQTVPHSDLFGDLSQTEQTRVGKIFTEALTAKGVPDHVKAVLTLLDGAYEQFDFSRGETPEDVDKTRFSQDAYRTALLKGAHIVFEDGGELCEALLRAGGQHEDGVKGTDGQFYSRKGESSHYFKYNNPNSKFDYSYTQTEQWGSDLGHAAKAGGYGGWLGHLMVGRDFNGNTFVQFENNGTATKTDKAAHGSDYLSHRWNNKKQVGPQGTIEASEKKHTELVAKPKVEDGEI